MSRRVLLIDDDQAISAALTVRLRAAGHEIILAADGTSGIQRAEDHFPDVILLDIRMPGIDGYEVCRRLKANPQLSDIPVIFVSANATESTAQQAYEVGGWSFISKPYEPAAVLAVIESAGSDSGPERASTLTD